ncbi:SET domain-containing protein-lysine N-methyltransferase [Aetokthonos hydrillicola Thurmond2011]|jgi:SET domain-containing protein|uniref:SET domain-containing protein-lysine N-methyltransferase n=1 Tax=Aetokthonos hydrillicola Thurmond2011 TaxID=2712845 RepID=A0AAP5I995_9CYAN|nr:SET domain-containing protein-lysine N-methyltransferase [Aetokthonos hydrillicola]MBO3462323.1 SET domain-containing protein [Aetokthonos hydrillicola CCALA 1050]MBW4588814.1 SET domain-containing protein-lysine N-methyltransferase [Aetokthonos hydrillicola CCALA 1050]MDR9897322.1 SET domain-containing protein-lysine N-methyltransferase [Aetokthonos hydrillicola Thurmond2011]
MNKLTLEPYIVKVTNKGKSVFANRFFRKGETVVVGHRIKILPDRTKHSFQMDFDLHIELDEPAQLINHSCSPNTGVRNNKFGGYDFVALVDIPYGSEITWDYETTEYISIAISKCLCGSPECRLKPLGFKFLPVEIRKKYGEFIADYLKRRLPPG